MRKGTKLDPALRQKRILKKKTLSERLNQILKERNLSQTELALKANMTDQMISDYCVGRAIPKSTSLLTLARVLDVHEGWLVGDLDKMQSFAEESKHYNLDIDQIAQILSIINASGSELINDYQGIIKKILQLNSTGISKLINYADDLIRLKEYRFIKKQTQENE